MKTHDCRRRTRRSRKAEKQNNSEPGKTESKKTRKQKREKQEKQRSRNSRKAGIQRKYLNLIKKIQKLIALHKKGLRQKHKPKVKRKRMFEGHSERNCRKNSEHQSQEPTNAWVHALTAISRFGNLLITAASKLGLLWATISRNSRATAQQLNQTRTMCLSSLNQS